MISLDGEWLFKIDSLQQGVAEKWFSPDHHKGDWQKVRLPSYWDRYNLGTYDGAGWFARTVDLPDTIGSLALFFEGVDDDAEVWVNGIEAGSHTGYSDAFYLDITSAVRPGRNEIVVRVMDHSGPGGIYKPAVLTPLARVGDLLRTEYSGMQARESADWVKDAVIYEVYVRSFSPEGTFKGLERRLAELKELRVTVLWLMPIHPIGDANRKGSLGSPYSVADYYAVNPEFGTLDDFKSLVKSTHEHGMKIIIDLVANHTAWDSKLMFEHPDWFTTDDEGAVVSPNADWTDVADLNYEHHELRKYMINVMKYWVEEIGIDGFRCDVAELVPTDFWETARRELDKVRPIMMLSEGTIPEHHVKAFDITYAWNTYDVLEKIIRGTTSASIIAELLRNETYRFPGGSLRMRFNSNHDKNAWDAPAVVKFGDGGAAASAVLTFTIPGVPLIYNGQEIGSGQRLDLFEKVTIRWNNEPRWRNLYKRLSEVREKHVALRRGAFSTVGNTGSEKIFSFVRSFENDTVTVVVSFSPRRESVEVQAGSSGRADEYVDALTGKAIKAADGSFRVILEPFGFLVVVPKGKG